jgi:hypothetical protein
VNPVSPCHTICRHPPIPRCRRPGALPGPTTRDIILRDVGGAPAPLLAQSYALLGGADIPFARYTSQALYDAEIEHMWSHTWQWACREEHIPSVGDYVVYDIGPYSVPVMRTQPGVTKAFAATTACQMSSPLTASTAYSPLVRSL